MEKLIIDINNPFHPLNVSKYPEDQYEESFELELSPSDSSVFRYFGDSLNIDWGDGTSQSSNIEKHIYTKDRFPLFYRIEVEFDPNTDQDFLNFRNNKYIKRIMGPLPRVSTSLLAGYFKGCTNLEMIGRDVFKYNQEHTNLSELFSGCSMLDYIDRDSRLSQIANNIDGILKDCINFDELPNIFNFENIKSANKAFMNMKSLRRIPMNYLEKATNLIWAKSIFEGCSNLRSMGYNPFYNCKSLKDISRGFAEIDTTLLSIKDNFYTYLPKDCMVDDIFTN